jgi:hypothetical protein|tara:strand:- start:537 stop:1040 length:504 start_codon:yes stop_codon:yes gene_type:complete
MKYLLTLIFCLFLTFGAYAQESNTETPEAPQEFKSLKDRPETVLKLQNLKNCTITYYNIGVYANLGGSIVELTKGDEVTREKFKMIFLRADSQHKLLQKQLDTLVDYLIKGGYHPLEIAMILEQATNIMLETLTTMIQDVMADPTKTNGMLTLLLEGTNKCDNDFLN